MHAAPDRRFPEAPARSAGTAARKRNDGENMTPAEEKAFAGAFSSGALVVPTWAEYSEFSELFPPLLT
jgi:hypothetical protein